MNHDAIVAFLKKQGYEEIDNTFDDGGEKMSTLVFGGTEVIVRTLPEDEIETYNEEEY